MQLPLIVCVLVLGASCIQCKVLLFEPRKSTDLTPTIVSCPDGEACPDETTCCVLPSGKYGCCPMPNAVCCEDKEHCCPENHVCDVAQQKCMSSGRSVSLTAVKSISAKSLPVEIASSLDTQCPDGTTCSGTCCKGTDAGYGCCPYEQASCCSDHVHCCPNGYTCNVAQQTCDQGFDKIPFNSQSHSAKPSKVVFNVVQCSDNTTQCPDGSTCCELGAGGFGCCPYDQAVCCADKEHCCPHNYKCDLQQQTCVSDSHEIPFAVAISTVVIKSTDVPCPGGESACPDGSTCCALAEGGFGCCPLPQAVCCADKEHCCPQGYTCDTTAGTCSQGGLSVPWSLKVPGISSAGAVTSSPAKDVAQCERCKSGDTCCNKKCCPFENGICCDDGRHCCPTGSSCDVKSRMCQSATNSLMFTWHLMNKQPISVPPTVDSVDCPDSSQCDDGNTCCKGAAGDYGCCPLDKAVCCSDGLHCCPNGTQCDLEHSKCIQAGVSSNMEMSWQLHKRQRARYP